MKAVVPVKEIILVAKLVFTAAMHTNSNGVHLGGVDFRFGWKAFVHTTY